MRMSKAAVVLQNGIPATVPSRRVQLCPICQRQYSRMESLRNHMNLVHNTTERPRHPCTFPGCGKTYQNKTWVVYHFRMEHYENPARFGCTLCGREFKANPDLVKHIATHTTEKPHKCSSCGTRFVQISSLKRHEKIHQPKSLRPVFTCRFCPISFASNCSLWQHKKIYHDNQRHPCNECGKVLKSYSGRRAHMLANHARNTDRTYSCEKCEYKSPVKANLLDHVRRKHAGGDGKREECYSCGKKFFAVYELRRHLGKMHTLEGRM